MSELNTPYFLEQDDTIRNGQNEIVTEILDEATEYKELHKMIETLNGIGYLNLQLATARAEVERLTQAAICGQAIANMVGVPRCDDFNHSNADLHTMAEECPVVHEFYLHRAHINKILATANIASATGRDEQGEGK